MNTIHSRWPVLFLLLSGACWPADPTGSYLNDAEDESTTREIQQAFGRPHATYSLDEGGERWTYHFEGDRYAWGGSTHRCVDYVLTFNSDGILTDWDREDC